MQQLKNRTHPTCKPRGNKYIIGYLPLNVSISKCFDGPIHRDECAAGAFFEMVKCEVSPTCANTLSALGIKIYY